MEPGAGSCRRSVKKNWAFGGHDGPTLTPAFDHVFLFPGSRHLVGPDRSLGVWQPDRIVDQVHQAVSGWKARVSATGVPDEDIGQLVPRIAPQPAKA